MPLKSLEDFNKEARERYFKVNDNSPRPNGLACPKCESELLDSNPMIVLSSNPPQLNVHCPNCEYRSYRVV